MTKKLSSILTPLKTALTTTEFRMMKPVVMDIQEFNERKTVFPILYQSLRHGIQCVFVREESEIKAFDVEGNELECIKLKGEIIRIFNRYRFLSYIEGVIDCEDKSLRDLVQVIHNSNDGLTNTNYKFVIQDLVIHDTDAAARHEVMEDIKEYLEVSDLECVSVDCGRLIKSNADSFTKYVNELEKGFEGLIVSNPTKMYKPGVQSVSKIQIR